MVCLPAQAQVVTPTQSFPTPAPSGLHDSLYLNFGLSSPNPYAAPLGEETGLQGGLGYGFGLTPTESLLIEARLSNLPLPGSYSWESDFFFSLLANLKFDLTGPDKPAVLYSIAGLGPSWIVNKGYYLGTDSNFRLGLGLDLRLSPGTALTLETDCLVTSLNPSDPWTLGFPRQILDSLVSAGVKFDDPGLHFPLSSPDSSSRRFFAKAAGGFNFTRSTFTHYPDRPVLNGLAQEVDDSQVGVLDFTGSVAMGFDFPDSFSFYLSGEGFTGTYWTLGDWALMANAQYSFETGSFFKPYLFGGLGMDFPSGEWGPAFQWGAGLSFPLEKDFGVYVEAKMFMAYVFYNYPLNPWLDFDSFALYTPVLAGVKYAL